MKWIELVFPIASVLAIYVARMGELRAKRQTVPGAVRETFTLRLFMLAGTLMLAGSIAEFLVRGLKLYWPTFLGGWLCALASFSLRRQAIAALGRFWSLHVEIREKHELVNSGPFRWVRHPTYVSMVLELLGLGLILNAYFSLAAVMVLFAPTLVIRLKLEESALVEKLGEAYREYQRTTPALFPYRWPRAK